MRIKIVACLIGMFCSSLLWGNTRVFFCNGVTPVLAKPENIQMVEEEVTMIPHRGNYPIDDRNNNMDYMIYHCVFKFRNLSDQKVVVQVGLPLSASLADHWDTKDIDQTEVIDFFNFTVGTKDMAYPVRYVPPDTQNRFSNIFLWEMSFEPKQEIILKVNYRMYGELFPMFANHRKEFPEHNDYKHEYLMILGFCIGEGFSYKTDTRNSWAGQIEKAVFKYYPLEFENYLKNRGLYEAEYRTESLVFKKVMEKTIIMPSFSPELSAWKNISEEKGNYLELSYAPFDPKENDRIIIIYMFLTMPQDVEKLEFILDETLKFYEKMSPEERKQRNIPPEINAQSIRKNMCDVVLEFYGVKTNNSEIQDFINNQMWYPVSNPPALSPELKARLELESNAKAN